MEERDSKRYLELGVSAAKTDVRDAVRALSGSVAPGSFCRVVPDVLAGDPEYCVVSHADGAGTKSILAYLHYRRHNDPDIFRGIAQDAVVMNLDDMLCVGATTGFAVTSIINRNARRIDGRVLKAIVDGTTEFVEAMNALDIRMVHCGGETADVGDSVRTLVVDSVLTARVARARLIHNAIVPGLAIVALAAGGAPSTYEAHWNSGIGSNGLTLARHELLSGSMPAAYPEILDDTTRREAAYTGPFQPDDLLPSSSVSVLDALLSPTRTFAPVVALALREYESDIVGIVHCSGGGQLKCLRFGRGIAYRKDLGPTLPSLYEVLYQVGSTSLAEMARVYNMGFRMEIYCAERAVAGILNIAGRFGVEAKRVGYTDVSESARNELTLTVRGETFRYSDEAWEEDDA
jgi:phosphoribosylformylglycinamidine cyclo-ligase